MHRVKQAVRSDTLVAFSPYYSSFVFGDGGVLEPAETLLGHRFHYAELDMSHSVSSQAL